VVVGVIIGSITTGAVTALQQQQQEEASASAAAAAKSSLFADAAGECRVTDVVEISDGDRTMVLDGSGDDFGSGEVTVDQIACVLRALDAPTAATTRMSETRALDGRQETSWDDISVTWTYHPDDGLDLIFELTD
jgi:hypothetical protein